MRHAFYCCGIPKRLLECALRPECTRITLVADRQEQMKESREPFSDNNLGLNVRNRRLIRPIMNYDEVTEKKFLYFGSGEGVSVARFPQRNTQMEQAKPYGTYIRE